MFKVMVIVGTRPEIIKLSRIVNFLEKNLKVILVHTGQNYDYELNEIFFKEMEIRKPDYFLEAAGESVAATIGNVISKVDPILDKEKPDAVLLYGDTNSCLSVITCKRRKIPIFHMEAGNRCFDQRVPEEINRKIVDHLSDINMVHSEHARRYLISEGIRPETIFKTGSPMREVLGYYKEKINGSNILNSLKLKKDDFFVVSIHREENVDYKENFLALLDSLNHLATTTKKRLIVSTHPRTKKRIEENSQVKMNPLVEFMAPMGFFDYVKLQMESYCVISDSGTITEESSILGFPGIMIRQAHERPEGMDETVVVMAGLEKESVELAVKAVRSGRARAIPDYEPSDVSMKVLRIILSYTGYVNRTVWKVD